MLKYEAPLWDRLRRHLQKPAQRPPLFQLHPHGDRGTAQTATTGQRLAEQVAAFVGSWWFLGGQAFFLFLWLVYNSLAITQHFDGFPYILLNLVLSFQAAFTGPVLLIAANVGALRDHQQADRIERLGSQNEQLTEQNEQLVQQLVNMEQLLERHVTQSLQAHTEQLADLNTLLREVHSSVCAPTASAEAVAAPTAPSPSPAPARSRPRGRSAPGGGTAG